MNIPLSKRLKACCDFVHSGDRVADIGCDHGYLSIYLLHNQIASYVIAADINPMPLQSAVANAERFGVDSCIEFHLSNGVQHIPQNFDTLVCAGMGADTMISILENAPWLKNAQYRLILQCQSKAHILRNYLSKSGWHIRDEVVLRDGRFLYTIMEVCYEPNQPRLTPSETYFSPALLQHQNSEVAEYYHGIVFRLNRTISGKKDAADPTLVQAAKELNVLTSQYDFLKEDPR